MTPKIVPRRLRLPLKWSNRERTKGRVDDHVCFPETPRSLSVGTQKLKRIDNTFMISILDGRSKGFAALDTWDGSLSPDFVDGHATVVKCFKLPVDWVRVLRVDSLYQTLKSKKNLLKVDTQCGG